MAYDIDQGTTDTDQGTSAGLATLSNPTGLAPLSRVESQQVRDLLEASKRPNTQAAYQSDLRQVATWLHTNKPDLAARAVRLDDAGRPALCGA